MNVSIPLIALAAIVVYIATGTWDSGPGTLSSVRFSASCSPQSAPHRKSGTSFPELSSGSKPPERGDARCRTSSVLRDRHVKSHERNQIARDIASGFASEAPMLSVAWDHIQAALADARDLAMDVTRLSAELRSRVSGTPTRLPRCAPRSALSATVSEIPGTTSATSWTRCKTFLGRTEGSAMMSYCRMRRQARQSAVWVCSRRRSSAPTQTSSLHPPGCSWLGSSGATAPTRARRGRRAAHGHWLWVGEGSGGVR